MSDKSITENIYLSRFQQLFKPLRVPAKTVLLREGEISKKAYFIEKGCIRTWYNNNGRDITFQFFFENEGVSSIESFNHGTPSLFNMETIEPCELQWIHKSAFDKVLEENPAVRTYMMEITLERQFRYMHQFLSLLKDTPPQRYASLLKDKPHVLQRVPLQYIASYLGITPVSLSRIRNKKDSG